MHFLLLTSKEKYFKNLTGDFPTATWQPCLSSSTIKYHRKWYQISFSILHIPTGHKSYRTASKDDITQVTWAFHGAFMVFQTILKLKKLKVSM